MTRGAEAAAKSQKGPQRGSSGRSGEVGVPSSLATSLGSWQKLLLDLGKLTNSWRTAEGLISSS